MNVQAAKGLHLKQMQASRSYSLHNAVPIMQKDYAARPLYTATLPVTLPYPAVF